MNERVRLLRKELGLTLEKFGNRIGVTKNAISNIENKSRNVTKQMLKAICREFNVREEWLQYGTGNMFEELTKEERVAAMLGEIFTDRESELYDFKLSVLRELGKLDKKDWEVIQKIVDGISRE